MADILILGATSALAQEVAKIYAARGDQLYLLGRNPKKLSALVEELGDCVRGHALLDALDGAACAEEIKVAWAHCQGFDVALVAHGWLGDQIRAESEAEHARAIIDLNFGSVVTQLVALQQHFARQGSGHIAVCGSVAAERGRPRNFTYGAAKAGLETYLEGLRSVLWPQVQVHMLTLGPIDTPMTVDHEKNFSFSQPQHSARAIVRAIDRGRSKAFIPGWWRPVMFAVRHMPEWLFQRLGFLSNR